MTKLRIDPEIQKQIIPLTDAEFELLRDNILSDGEVYAPIIVWNGTIIDGHNRWRVICEHWDLLKDKYRIKEMNFPDKRAALEWIYRKQLGSRNLTNMQRTYIIGKIYEARKNTNSFKGNQFHNQSSHKQSLNTADLIGKEIGIAGRSVRRAEKYSKGIDALRGASVDAANKVLNGQSNLTKENVGELSKMEPKEVEDIALAIVSDEPLPQQRADQGHTSLDNQENVEELDAFIADLCDYSPVPDYKVDCIFYENQFCTREYVQQARQVLKGYREVFVSENNHDISDVITRYLSKMLRKLKGILK